MPNNLVYSQKDLRRLTIRTFINGVIDKYVPIAFWITIGMCITTIIYTIALQK